VAEHESVRDALDPGILLQSSAVRFFSDEAEHLLALRQLDVELLPACHANVAILAELAGWSEPEAAGAEFAVPYLVLLAHCDLLDAAVDGEANGTTDLLAIAGTLARFWGLIEDDLMPQVGPDKRHAMRQSIRIRLAERSGALRVETLRRQTWEPPNALDAAAAAGRSACIVLFYEILCGLAGREPNIEIGGALSDYLHAFQLGDDLGDWEADLAAGNHTELLRGCVTRLDSGVPFTGDAIARELFLGGHYEKYTAQLIRRIDEIVERLERIEDVKTDRLCTYIRGKRADAVFLLTEVVRTKFDGMAAAPGSSRDAAPVVRHSCLTYPLFQRLIRAARAQPEFQQAYGDGWWWLLWRLRFLIYLRYRRDGRSQAEIRVVERDGEVIGAFGLMPNGELSTAIVVGTPAERRSAMRALLIELDQHLTQSTDRVWAMTGSDFRSLTAVLESRGFTRLPTPWSRATLSLGPWTWTWTTRRNTLPGVRLEQQVYLVRATTRG